MPDKKHIYQADTLTLPPLKMVLGEVPEPDPDGTLRPFRRFHENLSEAEARKMVTKLIGHLQNKEK